MANHYRPTMRIVLGSSDEGEQASSEEYLGLLTSAVFGTDSQKTSILMSPRLVCSVTDMAEGRFLHHSAHCGSSDTP